MPAPLRLATALLAAMLLSAAEPPLRSGDRIALIGDSITEQKLYTRFIAVYLLASSGVPDLDIAQFGWGGERVAGWNGRAQRSLAWFAPTVATTCYGMNDGAYRAFDEAVGALYRDGSTRMAAQLRASGVRTLVIGSPGVVDTGTYRRAPGAAVYNQSLGRLAGIAGEVATAADAIVADVHRPMLAAMASAKAAYGPDYHLAGADGVHPDHNGHLVMAQAFLTALGCDGAIARITLRADGGASASAGHTVVAAAPGMVELDSARWPFVLAGDGRSPASTRSIAAHCGFVAALDRFILEMPDCPWPQAMIAWGDRQVNVSGERLRAGVNLLDLMATTPFDGVAASLHTAVAAQQAAETTLVKQLLCMPGREQIEADAISADLLRQLVDRQIAVRHERRAAVQALLKPVRHTIQVAAAAPQPAAP